MKDDSLMSRAVSPLKPRDLFDRREHSLDEHPTLLHEFFERAARRWPHHVAVETPPSRTQPRRRSITYAELKRKTDALASYLREFVTEECVVSILLPRNS